MTTTSRKPRTTKIERLKRQVLREQLQEALERAQEECHEKGPGYAFAFGRLEVAVQDFLQGRIR